MINQTPKPSVWRSSINTLTVTVLLFGAFYLGQLSIQKKVSAQPIPGSDRVSFSITNTNDTSNIDTKEFKPALFWEAWQIVSNNYVDKSKLDGKKLFYGSMKGLVEATGDPYSVFMTPEENKEFTTDLSGKFEGIGAEIGLKNEIITVISPLEGMPAELAGIKAGDQIIKIDGDITVGFSVMQAVNKIRGAKGTAVKLTIFRQNSDKPLEFTITRDVIVVKSVRTEMTKDNIFVIRVSSFNDDTEQLFSEAVSEALLKKPRGIILDLRNNPGGYLNTAISMASFWVKDNIVVMERYGDGNTTNHSSVGEPSLLGMKTVVLVNEGSASASEIVAGALQDYGLATIVGAKTFGKGSVQILKELSDGSSIKVTAAKWLTPKGKSIDQQGVTPDIAIAVKAEDKTDQQRLKAIAIIKQ
jgi:carboxyl-terminal processing protease